MASKEPSKELAAIKREGEILKGLVTAKLTDWQSALAGSGMTAGQFAAGLYQAVRGNPRLLEAGTQELMNGAGRALALALDLSGVTGEAYLVGPLKRKDKLTVELWLGIKGQIKLAYRSGMVQLVRVEDVLDGDEFEVDPANPTTPVRHRMTGKGRVVAHYALVFLTTGGTLYGVVWADEVPKLQEGAKERLGGGFSRSPWATHPAEMAQVQALRRALKWAPKSVSNLALATDADRVGALDGSGTAALPHADDFRPDALTLTDETEAQVTVDVAAPEPTTEAKPPVPAASKASAGAGGTKPFALDGNPPASSPVCRVCGSAVPSLDDAGRCFDCSGEVLS